MENITVVSYEWLASCRAARTESKAGWCMTSAIWTLDKPWVIATYTR